MPLLRILIPNFLKLNAGANRSPGSLFTMPDSAPDLMKRIEEAYRTFYKVWNDSYVPLLSKRSKWHDGDVDLCENDIIYFKLTDSALASTWLIGKVDSIVKSKDGRIRKVLVGYKFNTEQGTREFRVVERPARECVKLMSVDDTTLLDDIREVREAAEAILGDEILHVRMDTDKIDERFHKVTTCACNQLLHLDSVFSCAAIDICTHSRSSYDVHAIDGYRDEIWSGERQLQIESDYDDEIFDIDNDYDKIYDDMIYLL